MDGYTIDFGAHGRFSLPLGGLLRVGDPSIRDAHLSLPVTGLHLLFHSVAEGVIVVNCSSGEGIQTSGGEGVSSTCRLGMNTAVPSSNSFEQKLLKSGERVLLGPIEFSLHSHGCSRPSTPPQPAEVGNRSLFRIGSNRAVLGSAIAFLTAGAAIWIVEWNRVERLERIAAIHLADTAIAMLADRIYGPIGGSFSGGSEVFYDPAIREKWLDRILTVDTKRETVRGTLYTLHLDEEPETGYPRLVAEPRAGWWRRLIGLQHRTFSCSLSQPYLFVNESDSVDWEWLGAEASGFVIPRRLARRGFSSGPLYNAQRYRGFTWPLREIAQTHADLLPTVFSALKELPGLFFQVFPDRRSEQQLWQALANLGEEETLPWELSPELTPSTPARLEPTSSRPARMVAERIERFAAPSDVDLREWVRFHSQLSTEAGSDPKLRGDLDRIMDAADRESLQAPCVDQIVQ